MFHFLSSVYKTVVTEEEPQKILFLGIEDSGKTTLFEQCKYLLSDDRRSLPMPRYVPRGPPPIEALSTLSSSSSYTSIATSTVSATPQSQDAVSPAASATAATNASATAYYNSNNNGSPTAANLSSSSVGGGSLTPTCSLSSTASPSLASMDKGNGVGGLSASPIRKKYIRTTIGLNVAKVRLSSKLRHVSPPPLAEQLTPIYCSDVNIAAGPHGHGVSVVHVVVAAGGTTAATTASLAHGPNTGGATSTPPPPPPLVPLTALDTTIVDQPLTLWDMGGKSDLRELWLSYLKQCDGIVFVIGLPVTELVQTQQRKRRGTGQAMSGLIYGSPTPRSCPCAATPTPTPSSSLSSSASPSYACCHTCPCYNNLTRGTNRAETARDASTPSFSSSPRRPLSPTSSLSHSAATLNDLVADSASVKRSKAVLHSLLVHPALLKVPILVVGNVMRDGGPAPLPVHYSGSTVVHYPNTSPSCAATPTPTQTSPTKSGETTGAPPARAAATPAPAPTSSVAAPAHMTAVPSEHATLTRVETEVRKQSLDEGSTASSLKKEEKEKDEDPSSKNSGERGSSTTSRLKISAHRHSAKVHLPKSHSLVSVSSATDTDTDEDSCTIRGEKEEEKDDAEKNTGANAATHGEEKMMTVTGRANGSFGLKEARRRARDLPKGRSRGPNDARGEGEEDEEEEGEEGSENETKFPSPSPFSSVHQSFEDSVSGKFVLVGTGTYSLSATTDNATHNAVVDNSNDGSVSGCGGGGVAGVVAVARDTAASNPTAATISCCSNSISTSTAAYASVSASASASVGGPRNDQHDDEASSVSSCCPSSHLHHVGQMPKEAKVKTISASATGSPITADMPVEDTTIGHTHTTVAVATVVTDDNEKVVAVAAAPTVVALTTRDLPPRHPRTPPPPPANSLPPLGRGGGGGLVSPPRRSACASSAATGEEPIRGPNSNSSFVLREDGVCYNCGTGGGVSDGVGSGSRGGAPAAAAQEDSAGRAKGKEDSGHTNHQPPHHALLLEAFEESLGLPSVIAGAITELEATIAGGNDSASKGGGQSSSVADDTVAAENNSSSSSRRSVSTPRREGSVSSVFGSALNDGVSGAPFGNSRTSHRVLFDVATRRYKVVLLDAMEGNGVVDALCWLSSTIRSVKEEQEHAAAVAAGR